MKALIVSLVVAFLSLLTTGCTAVGIGIGKMVDNKNAQFRRVQWTETRAVPHGRDVLVTLTSGDTLFGYYAGSRNLPPDSYRQQYDSTRIRLAADSVLPRYNETVSAFTKSGQQISGVFRGFEAETMVIIQPMNYSTTYLPLSRASRLQDSTGRAFDVNRIRALNSSRTLPSDREILVYSKRNTHHVPLEHIQEVYAPPRSTNYWILGGITGLVVDVIVVAAATSALISSLDFDLDMSSDYSMGMGSWGGGY